MPWPHHMNWVLTVAHMVQYLHFRILKFPLISWGMVVADFPHGSTLRYFLRRDWLEDLRLPTESFSGCERWGDTCRDSSRSFWLCGHEFSFLCCWRHEREGSHYLGTDIVSFGLSALQSLVKRVPWADSSCFVARWLLCPMRVMSQLVWQDFDWISNQHSGRIQSAPGVPGSNDLQPQLNVVQWSEMFTILELPWFRPLHDPRTQKICWVPLWIGAGPAQGTRRFGVPCSRIGFLQHSPRWQKWKTPSTAASIAARPSGWCLKLATIGSLFRCSIFSRKQGELSIIDLNGS